MVVLHVNWTGGALWIWGESADSARRLTDTEATGASDGAAPHPFACDLDALSTALSAIGLTPGPDAAARLTLRLPTASGRPAPSPTLAHSIGWRSTGLESAADVSLEDWDTPAIGFATTDAARVLERLEDLADRAAESEETPAESASSATCGPSVEYFATAARFARSLVAQQRITPMVVQDATGALRGAWSPWLSDEKTSERAAALLRSMPGIARAVHDEFEHQPWPILQDFLGRFVDQMCRRALARERMIEAIEDRSTEKDLQVAWLAGLLDREEGVPALGGRRSQLVRGVRDWVATLDDRGSDVEWRLCLRLNEPFLLTEPEDFASPDEDFVWSISFHLQSVDREGVMLDADEIWSLTGESTAVDGRRVEDPKHLLLAELARAARIYNVLERVLAEDAPTELELTTNQSYNFLREIRPLLLEQGFGVITPKWWESPAARVGARLEIDSDPLPPGEEGGPARSF
ncbi:MAG: SNF2 helicase-associated domain-containing protein, partial [Planctomycetota bacterium]|nr:SNF2 helicase-associated domain-containing protein [Planctomycetota bacterium]